MNSVHQKSHNYVGIFTELELFGQQVDDGCTFYTVYIYIAYNIRTICSLYTVYNAHNTILLYTVCFILYVWYTV